MPRVPSGAAASVIAINKTAVDKTGGDGPKKTVGSFGAFIQALGGVDGLMRKQNCNSFGGPISTIHPTISGGFASCEDQNRPHPAEHAHEQKSSSVSDPKIFPHGAIPVRLFSEVSGSRARAHVWKGGAKNQCKTYVVS